MKVEMLMPQMGESITEATVSRWLKKVGDSVQKDETILEISTDKVDSEIPSPASGVIVEILFNQGDVVPVKTKIAVIDTEATGSVSAPQAPIAPVPAPASEQKVAAAAVTAPAVESIKIPVAGRFFSPLVLSIAAKHNISVSELEAIKGSGQAGRVNKEDLLGYIQSKSAPKPAPQSQPTKTPAPQSISTSAVSDSGWNSQGDKVIPMDNMRQLIADHMVRSKHTSPHVYSIQEVDVSKISKWRAKYKDQFKKSEGFNLSFTPFFLEAAVKGLQQFPYVNCQLDGKKIILHRHVNLGCAVALGNTGLIVPVIKNAEEKNFVGIARALNDLAERARAKKLTPTDVQGGTFTVTNPGVFGTIIGTPIINQPQVAILCLGAIQKRPVVVDDMIAIREMAYLTLSYDHRIIDGAMGGQYLKFICDYLENWDPERALY